MSSFRTLGTSLIKRSRMIPPPAPVKQAKIPADIKFNLLSAKAVAPIKEKMIKPIESKIR